MFSQNRNYFRFRFSRVMVFVFLLISPTQASSAPKSSCAEVVKAWMATDQVQVVTLLQDPKFIANLAECIHGIKEASVTLAAKLKPIIKQLPELIDKAMPFAEKAMPYAQNGGLVLLSVYILYRSYELYDKAIKLEEDYKQYREEFEALKEEMKPYLDLIVTQLIPQWKKGNTAKLQKTTDELLKTMGRHLTKIRELVQNIHRDRTNAESYNRWSVFYSVLAVATCGGSLVAVNIPMIVVSCGGGSAAVAFNIVVLIKEGDNLGNMRVLQKEVNIMRKEITKYRAQLHVAKMRGEL